MPAALIERAIDGNADLEKLEKLLALQERWEANEAKKAYISAMARFKADPPKIEKDRSVSYQTLKGTTTAYDHASLANVCDKINSALSAHGLSAAWSTNQYKDDPNVYVTCTITHEMGHSESTTLHAAPDSSGSKNPIQAVGSTISYLERYTVLALTGLATHDMDMDGASPRGVECIDQEEQNAITVLLRSIYGKDFKPFLDHIKVDSVEMIPKKDFKKHFTGLNDILEKRKAKTNADNS